MGQANLYLIRHGETLWNAEERLQGRLESNLSPEGREQVRSLLPHLSGIPIARIYCSTMIRACESAEILAEVIHSPIYREETLCEASFGAGEGMLKADFHEKYAASLARYRTLPLEEKWHYQLAEGSETHGETVARALPTLHRIAQTHIGEHVLIVTHGGVVRSICGHILGRDPRSISTPNAAYAHLIGDGQSFEIMKYHNIGI